MKRLQTLLSPLPPWTLTLATVAAILWLTLSPAPLGPQPPLLFPGADKVVHALMFGFLTLMLCLDRQRAKGWKSPAPAFVWGAAAASALLGTAIEFAQLSMGLGRGFETSDILADAVGAALAAILWIECHNRFRRKQ